MKNYLARLVLLIPMAALSACTTNVMRAEEQVVIKNFTRGLICGANEAQRRVCFDTEEIQITGEGRCIFNGRPAACTWYGISFDYVLPKDGVKLECIWQSSHPANVGNPKALLQEGVTSGTFELDLKNNEGHYFLPQYLALLEHPTYQAPGQILRVTQSCSYQGTKLFEFSFNRHLPES